MIDSSSEGKDSGNDTMAEMAGELIQAKMDAARNPPQMTHLLQIGSFRMEIVPSKDIDVNQLFKETIADLYEMFGEEVLKINTSDIIAQQEKAGRMHG